MAENYNNSPLVSVIIPCYNAEKYVEAAVRSIMNQTYKNLEILCCDDCSTDRTFSILQELADEDSRIKLFKNETNQKIVKTLNNLVSLANGKYIARMDADDISLPKRIEKQVEFLEENSDIAFCGTNAWHIDENGEKIGFSCLPRTNDEINKFKFYACPFYHPAVMIRSSVYKENFYDENFLYAEDYELWIRLLEKYKGYNLKERLIFYRIFFSQTSKMCFNEQQIKSAEIFVKYNLKENKILRIEEKLNALLKLDNDEKKEFEYYVKDLFSSNAICDLVLFIKLCKVKFFFFSFWTIREIFALVRYIFQSKILLKTF